MNRYRERLRNGWQQGKARAGSALAGAALFLLGMLLGIQLFLPITAVQQWLTAELAARTAASVTFDQLSLRPLFVLRAHQAAITLDSRTPPVILEKLRLQPLWTSLLTGNPGLTVNAALLQGQLDAAVRGNGEFSLQAAGLKLNDFPLHRDSRTLLSGTLVKGVLRGSFPVAKNADNRLLVEMDNCAVTVLGQRLVLGRIAIEGDGQGNTLRLARLTATGGELTASGSGSLLLGSSVAASRINLDLFLRPAPAADPRLATLLELAARRQDDGSYHLKLSGPPDRLTFD